MRNYFLKILKNMSADSEIEYSRINFENFSEEINENTKDFIPCAYKGYDNKINFDSISKYYRKNNPLTWPTKLLANKNFLEILSVVKNFDFEKKILYEGDNNNTIFDIIYTCDINLNYKKKIKEGGTIIYKLNIEEIKNIDTTYFKTIEICKPILCKISDNNIFVILSDYSQNANNKTIVSIGKVLELYSEYVNTKSFLYLGDILNLEKSFQVFTNIIKLNRNLKNLKFHTRETETILRYANDRNFHILSLLYAVKDNSTLNKFKYEIERSYDYILSDKKRMYLTSGERNETFDIMNFNILQVQDEIDKFGIKKISNQILNHIKENKIPFPIKYCTKDVILGIFNKIKEFKKCENSRWRHEKYYIQRAIFDREYTFAFPDIVGDNLNFKKPIYYLFENFHSDYWNYNIITDYFMEKSRIKSFIKTYNNKTDSPYYAWETSDDYKLGAIEKILSKNENFNIENLREALYEDKVVKEVSYEKVIFLSAVFSLLLGKNKNSRIFDACAGWGDRYIASFLCGAETYIGVEPNDDSIVPFEKMNEILNSKNENFMVLHDYMPLAKLPNYVSEEYFDLCFLSPPSFDSENYGDSEGQSNLIFHNREEMKESFLKATIEKCWNLLKNGGYFVVQSIIIQEIMPIIEKNNDAIYLGAISVTGERGRVKPLWIWMKFRDTKKRAQIISNPKINILTDKYSTIVNQINVFAWKNINYKNDYHYLLYKPTDYFYNPDFFIKSLEKIRNLYNPISTIKWNLYKDYLIELQNLGIAVVPTNTSNHLIPNEFRTNKLIIKPICGGGSYNVFHFNMPRTTEDCKMIEKFLFTKSNKVKYPYKKGSDFIIQPYFEHEEEYSLIYYFDGFSHAVIKTKINKDEISSFKNRKISKFNPEKELEDFGYKVLLNSKQKFLFARLDFIRYNNKYYLMELEFIDPILFYDSDAEQLYKMVEKLKKYLKV